jgi:uncharacterized membrane protein YbhN (UPF0104 family)
MLPAEDPDQNGAAHRADQTRQWRLLLIGFLALLVVFGLVLLIERAAGYEGVLNRLRRADPVWLALAISAEAVSFAGFAAAVRGVFAMRGGKTMRYPVAARLVFASLGASRTVLGGGPAGIAVFLWGARKTGFARSQAASRVLALYVLQFGVLAIGTWLCALSVALSGRGLALPHFTVPWLVAVPLIVAAAATFRAPALRGWFPGRIGGWLENGLAEIEDGFGLVRAIASHPRKAAVLLTAAALDWLGDAFCLWASLSAFGLVVRPDRFLLAYSTAYLITLLPLPFAGIGTVEAMTVLSLRAIGVPVSAGFLAVLAYRAINFWLPTVPGLISLATMSRLGRRLAQTRPQPAATEVRR